MQFNRRGGGSMRIRWRNYEVPWTWYGKFTYKDVEYDARMPREQYAEALLQFVTEAKCRADIKAQYEEKLQRLRTELADKQTAFDTFTRACETSEWSPSDPLITP